MNKIDLFASEKWNAAMLVGCVFVVVLGFICWVSILVAPAVLMNPRPTPARVPFATPNGYRLIELTDGAALTRATLYVPGTTSDAEDIETLRALVLWIHAGGKDAGIEICWDAEQDRANLGETYRCGLMRYFERGTIAPDNGKRGALR